MFYRAGRYEVDGYVYNSAEEPKILMTGKWNESMSYQPCDLEGEPLPDTELKEVIFLFIKKIFTMTTSNCLLLECKHSILAVLLVYPFAYLGMLGMID